MPLAPRPTTGSILEKSIGGLGREAFRKGEAYDQHAAPLWQAGWIDEANLAAKAAANPAAAAAIDTIAAQRALEAARRVLDECTIRVRPTPYQQRILAEAEPLIADALARFKDTAPTGR